MVGEREQAKVVEERGRHAPQLGRPGLSACATSLGSRKRPQVGCAIKALRKSLISARVKGWCRQRRPPPRTSHAAKAAPVAARRPAWALDRAQCAGASRRPFPRSRFRGRRSALRLWPCPRVERVPKPRRDHGLRAGEGQSPDQPEIAVAEVRHAGILLPTEGVVRSRAPRLRRSAKGEDAELWAE